MPLVHSVTFSPLPWGFWGRPSALHPAHKPPRPPKLPSAPQKPPVPCSDAHAATHLPPFQDGCAPSPFLGALPACLLGFSSEDYWTPPPEVVDCTLGLWPG